MVSVLFLSRPPVARGEGRETRKLGGDWDTMVTQEGLTAATISRGTTGKGTVRLNPSGWGQKAATGLESNFGGAEKGSLSSPGPVWHTWDGNLEVSRKWAERPQDGQAGRSEVAVSLRTC